MICENCLEADATEKNYCDECAEAFQDETAKPRLWEDLD